MPEQQPVSPELASFTQSLITERNRIITQLKKAAEKAIGHEITPAQLVSGSCGELTNLLATFTQTQSHFSPLIANTKDPICTNREGHSLLVVSDKQEFVGFDASPQQIRRFSGIPLSASLTFGPYNSVKDLEAGLTTEYHNREIGNETYTLWQVRPFHSKQPINLEAALETMLEAIRYNVATQLKT